MDGPLAQALRASGAGTAEGQAPRPGGKVSPVPLTTIELFLGYVEILREPAEGVSPEARAAEREAAIREFQQRYGLPVDGQPSPKLLGYLIWAAQPGPAVGELAPLDGTPALYLAPRRP
jgi:peptidoglycan hydrolase-like protein with peptidoglycan-binding domain